VEEECNVEVSVDGVEFRMADEDRVDYEPSLDVPMQSSPEEDKVG
jgi:hypothetical protein